MPSILTAGHSLTDSAYDLHGGRADYVYEKSDKTSSGPLEDPVHPRELLATIYHAFGIDSDTLVYNHLNQPRELVKGQPVTGLFA